MNIPQTLYCARTFESDALSPPNLSAFLTPANAFAACIDQIVKDIGDVQSVEIRTNIIVVTTKTGEKFHFTELKVFEIEQGPMSVWEQVTLHEWTTPYAVHAFVKVRSMTVTEYVDAVTNVNKVVDDIAA